MHNEVKKFIKHVRKTTRSKYGFKSQFRFKDVLEVGSLNVNGSPRKYFWFCNYCGIDLMPGKGVDIVTSFSPQFNREPVDVIISTEMLEHNSTWRYSLLRMYVLLKPGGLLLITCAGPDRPEHGTFRTTPQDSPATTDHYRNISHDDFRGVLPSSLFSTYVLQYARGQNDLQFFGIKK